VCALIPEAASVLIVGGGPCGLTLAIELGRRGIDAALVDQKPSAAVNPQANATQEALPPRSDGSAREKSCGGVAGLIALSESGFACRRSCRVQDP